MEIELSKLVGRRVIVMGPRFLENDKPQSVKLLAVETAGIWVESQLATEKLITSLQKKASSEAVAFFIPFAQVTTIIAGVESTADQQPQATVSATSKPD